MKSVIPWCLTKLHLKVQRRGTGFHLKHAFLEAVFWSDGMQLLVSLAQFYLECSSLEQNLSLFSTIEFINKELVNLPG